jgi:hypothetical protein
MKSVKKMETLMKRMKKRIKKNMVVMMKMKRMQIFQVNLLMLKKKGSQ